MSTQATKPSAATEKRHETTAGNYFVANYPPFSFWSAKQIGEAHSSLDCAPKAGTPLGLYVHIPFCRKRCHFCYFKVYTEKNASEVERYLDCVVEELRLYAGKAFVGGRKPNFVYFGGGTPSYLSVKQLGSLTDRLKALLPWDAAEEVAFEAEPGTLTNPKLAVIKEMGVTRLSLGVENFDDHILEINGRAHRSPEILRAYDYAQMLGFDQINIDLIAGMVEEHDDNWRACVRQTIELAPDSVTIYEMEIPYNTTIYQQMKAEGKLVAPVADWETKREWVRYAFNEFEKAGYAIASAYTAVKDPARTKFLYRDRLWEGADLLGLGVASFSHIGGVHFQNEHNIIPYMEQVGAGSLPLWRALRPTDEEKLIRELVLQLKLGHISVAYFQKKFGVDIRERFSRQLQHLTSAGLLQVVGDVVTLSREALLQVDSLLHDFFLPEHRDVRYA